MYLRCRNSELSTYRQTGAGMIFQDPSSALNPVISIKNQFLVTLKYAHKGKNYSKEELLKKAAGIVGSSFSGRPGPDLEQLSLPAVGRNETASLYCHDLGGGAAASAGGRAGNRAGCDDPGPDSAADQISGGSGKTFGDHGYPFSWESSAR